MCEGTVCSLYSTVLGDLGRETVKHSKLPSIQQQSRVCCVTRMLFASHVNAFDLPSTLTTARVRQPLFSCGSIS